MARLDEYRFNRIMRSAASSLGLNWDADKEAFVPGYTFSSTPMGRIESLEEKVSVLIAKVDRIIERSQNTSQPLRDNRNASQSDFDLLLKQLDLKISHNMDIIEEVLGEDSDSQGATGKE